ncbi:hypothetical protein [Amycolatopsis sacchari]|uniref:hypothetical protein n=1 Tax=Amycolatopsis sacchari TaxID=115433 RepID=UPI003D74923E
MSMLHFSALPRDSGKVTAARTAPRRTSNLWISGALALVTMLACEVTLPEHEEHPHVHPAEYSLLATSNLTPTATGGTLSVSSALETLLLGGHPVA